MRVQLASLMIVIVIGGSLALVTSTAIASSVSTAHDGLHLQYENIPPMHLRYVFVSGTVPQVDPNYQNFGHQPVPSFGHVLQINSDVESLVNTSESNYWRTLVKLCTPLTKSFSDLEKQPGYFATKVNPELILANDRILSFVVPTFWSVCQGTGNEGAISSTYSLLSGKSIDPLSVLFASRIDGEHLLAKLVSTQFNKGTSVGDRCVQQQGFGPVTSKAMLAGIESANALGVTHVSLGKKGISVLVDQCYLAACACGDSLAQIPYAKIWNLLSKSGQNLLLGAY